MRLAFAVPALFASSFVLAACAKPPVQEESVPRPEPQHASATSIKPLEKKRFGAEITEKTTVALNAIMKEPGKYGGQTVRTEGVVSAVCKSMGCWMEITDEAGQAHIKMAGHAFFVPKDASGHRAAVQGKILGGDKDHCTEEAEEQTGKVAKVQIEATGVEFLD